MEWAAFGLWLLVGLGLVDALCWTTLLYRFEVGFRRSPMLERYPPVGPRRRCVAAVVAARNEQENIGECVRSLLSQSCVGSVIVVDDGSSDATYDVASSFTVDDRVRVLRLEGGVGGKAEACHYGAAHAQADWLLFVDADTRLKPGAVDRALTLSESLGFDALSLIGGLRCRGFWDKVCTPFLFGLLNSFIPLHFVCDKSRRSAYFYGSFILIKSEAYWSIGGHRAVRGEIVEDRALGSLAKKSGLKVCIAWAPTLVSAEWAPGLREGVRAMERVAAPSISGRLGLGSAFCFALTALFFIPVMLLAAGTQALHLKAPILIACLVLGGLSLCFGGALSALSARRIGSSPLYAPFFLLAEAVFSYALWSSVGKVLRGRPVVWRGREYVFGRAKALGGRPAVSGP